MTKQELVDRVQDLTGIDERHRLDLATEAAVGTLCGRLTRGEVEDILGAVHDMCGIERAERPENLADKKALLDLISHRAGFDELTSLKVAKSVFKALKDEIPDHEIGDIAEQLPSTLKVIWLES